MNHFRQVGIAVLALSIGFGGLASAQERDHDRSGHDRYDHSAERRGGSDRNDRHHRAGRSEPRDLRSAWRDRAGRDERRDAWDHGRRGDWREPRGEWRGAGPRHDLRRGGYLSPQYRSRQYVVDDWRGRRLSAPPRGYHWVQAGGDYVLAAIATGLIVQFLLAD